MTWANYRKRRSRRADPGEAKARLFSRRVESGIITAATWGLITALPAELRSEYENLIAESIALYPRTMAAHNGAEYDQFLIDFGTVPHPWRETLDLPGRKKMAEEYLDSGFVSLQFPVRDFARRFAEFREAARNREGKGSGAEKAWKARANTLFGVLASSRFATGNAVAANQITASGRAGAFVLMHALNGIQVVTDGCSYRRDQVPACSLAECLNLQPDYLLHRAEAGGPIPFLDPSEIPEDDKRFTTWFHRHAKFFLGGHTGAAPSLGLGHLIHKVTPSGATSFDALACDGSGNYVKCFRDAEVGWVVCDSAMRGYHGPARDAIIAWMIATYSCDRMESLPPPVAALELLKLKEAQGVARQALSKGLAQVVFPLGHPRIHARNYQALRPSAYIFQTPKQRKAIIRQFERFEQQASCGLELLSLRRGYERRAHGSIQQLARVIYEHIRSGKHDLARILHTSRLSGPLEEVARSRSEKLEKIRIEGRADLLCRIDPDQFDGEEILAATLCTAAGSPPLTEG